MLGSRIAPSWGALSDNGGGAWGLAYWPKFDVNCCKESLNFHGQCPLGLCMTRNSPI